MVYIYYPFVLTLIDAAASVQSARNPCDFVMKLDIQKNARYVEGFDLSDKQKRDLIQTVWQIMEGFADLGWGIHPLQEGSRIEIDKDCQAKPSCIESRDNNPKMIIGQSESSALEAKADS